MSCKRGCSHHSHSGGGGGWKDRERRNLLGPVKETQRSVMGSNFDVSIPFPPSSCTKSPVSAHTGRDLCGDQIMQILKATKRTCSQNITQYFTLLKKSVWISNGRFAFGSESCVVFDGFSPVEERLLCCVELHSGIHLSGSNTVRNPKHHRAAGTPDVEPPDTSALFVLPFFFNVNHLKGV